jgi:hypothetical protein
MFVITVLIWVFIVITGLPGVDMLCRVNYLYVVYTFGWQHIDHKTRPLFLSSTQKSKSVS